MPEQRVSETTYRDPLDSFTDREETLTLFEQFLDVAQPGQISFLALKGNSGIGKTFLISYLTRHVCPKKGWQTGQISFSQTSVPEFRAILAGIEDGLKGCVPRERASSSIATNATNTSATLMIIDLNYCSSKQ